MEIDDKSSKLIKTAPLILLTAAGAAFRLYGAIGREMEYDEIWTLEFYVRFGLKKIFTDLATPNNHPLHSFAALISTSILGESAYAMRFPSLICGILLIPVVYRISILVFKSKTAAITSAGLAAFHGALIHFSQTARGYSIQTLLCSLFLLCLIRAYQEKTNTVNTVLLFISGICAVLTLPTSILFIGSAMFLFTAALIIRKKTINPALLISGWLSCVVGIIWIVLNLKDLKAGQNFGNDVTGISSFLSFFFSIIKRPISLPLIAGSLFLFLKKERRIQLYTGLFLISTPLLAALFTKAGPPRVYLPLVPIACCLCAGGIDTLAHYSLMKRIKNLSVIISVITLFLAASFAPAQKTRWEEKQWNELIPILQQKFKNNYFIFKAADSLLVSYNIPDMAMINCNHFPSNEKAEIILINTRDLSLVFPEHKLLSPPASVNPIDCAGLQCYRHELEKIEPDTILSPDDLLIAFAGPGKHNLIKSFSRLFRGWGIVNPWLNKTILSENELMTAFVYAVKTKNAHNLENIHNLYPDVRIYRFTSKTTPKKR